MKKWVHDMLVCPECLGDEIPLDLDIKEETAGDVMEGKLSCSTCNRYYPIHRGIAVILPDKILPVVSDSEVYNSRSMLSSYLWSHFCDMFKDPQATEAYRIWSSLFKNSDGPALDIGCSVGRLSFELSNTHSHVVGIDTSMTFIHKARELLNKKRLEFDLIIEGLITEKRACDFNDVWHFNRIDFIVADALALPFRKNTFSTVTSINILEKVSHPLNHLTDINRVLHQKKSMFIFSDPFSWDEAVSPPEHWIGGVVDGNGAPPLRGIDKVIRYLWGKDNVFNPPMEVTEKGQVSWKIRKTENLWEHITSQFVVGMRR